jgi:hypothetical protein
LALHLKADFNIVWECATNIDEFARRDRNIPGFQDSGGKTGAYLHFPIRTSQGYEISIGMDVDIPQYRDGQTTLDHASNLGQGLDQPLTLSAYMHDILLW